MLLITTIIFSKKNVNDANIIGHVVCKGKHISYANIIIKGTTIGTSTDETGHFQIINVSPGKITLAMQTIGYKTQEKEIKIEANETIEVKFDIEKDVLQVDEIVITGSKQSKRRAESITIVNSIPIEMLKSTSSISVSEGLNFCSGLRMENNCQNCGFNQVRVNGLEGPYSQVLINGNAIFSGLAGVYGLELIPVNMIEKIEIVKGGGSSIYGGNAIAGTINLRLKTPKRNSFNLSYTNSIIGVGVNKSRSVAPEHIINTDASIITSDRKSGLSIYALNRTRDNFDANNDDFSEIAELKNTTFGTRMFHNFDDRDKLAIDFFVINEERRGGNKFNYSNHEADISEYIKHRITTGALTYTRFFRDIDLLNIFASAQNVDRNTYYGANKSLSDYGKTKGLSFAFGSNYSANFNKLNFIGGFEFNGETLKDEKLGYLKLDSATTINNKEVYYSLHEPNKTVADQKSFVSGLFAQFDYKLLKNLKISAGARFDSYKIKNKVKNSEISGTVFCPRLNFLYNISSLFQLRGSYSTGYRAPQIFDEDLHIETSGARKIIHEHDHNLKQENSQSFMGSLNFRKKIMSFSVEFLVEGFYTMLDNPFANERTEPDENGLIIYTRKNAEKGAKVVGANLEFRFNAKDLKINLGFTSQISEYEEKQDLLGDGKFLKKNFLRTPNNYGFITIDYDFLNNFCFNLNGVYTGEMDILHETKEKLFTSNNFFDIGVKLSYKYKINGTYLKLSAGMKIFSTLTKIILIVVLIETLDLFLVQCKLELFILI